MQKEGMARLGHKKVPQPHLKQDRDGHITSPMSLRQAVSWIRHERGGQTLNRVTGEADHAHMILFVTHYIISIRYTLPLRRYM